MKYICHRKYRQKGASGRKYFFKRGVELETIGGFIEFNGGAVCGVSSEDAHKYFSRNDDGFGLMRGELTYAIAYKKRKPNEDNEFRFTPEEIEMLRTEYPFWLKDDSETILFNDDFFNAEVEELKTLLKRLEVE